MMVAASTVLDWLDYVIIFAVVVVANLLTGRFPR